MVCHHRNIMLVIRIIYPKHFTVQFTVFGVFFKPQITFLKKGFHKNSLCISCKRNKPRLIMNFKTICFSYNSITWQTRQNIKIAIRP